MGVATATVLLPRKGAAGLPVSPDSALTVAVVATAQTDTAVLTAVSQAPGLLFFLLLWRVLETLSQPVWPQAQPGRSGGEPIRRVNEVEPQIRHKTGV